MVPDIGQRYGPYEIVSRIGGGGMGHVFRAWDARLHREVAIKLLHNEFSMPGMRERFLREARAASALNHPNICTIFDIGEQRGDPYLVMEMLQGITLKDRIQHEAIPVDQLVCVAREVAEALAAAHSKGVVHRDIKPANIFLVAKPTGGHQAKVLDFGLAKFEGGSLGSRGSRALDLTAAGATVGTLAYMSPEQARGEALDSRSDLFSLGVVLYEMATRRIPFTGATSALVFVQLLNHAPEPVREWNESIPRELEKIILKLLAKDKAARFQTAQELDEALARLSDKASGSNWLRKVTVPLVRAPEPVARERRSSRRRLVQSRIAPGAPTETAAESSTHSRSEAQVLRPVARLPSVLRTPARPSAHLATADANSHTPASLAEGWRDTAAGGVVQISAGAAQLEPHQLEPAQPEPAELHPDPPTPHLSDTETPDRAQPAAAQPNPAQPNPARPNPASSAYSGSASAAFAAAPPFFPGNRSMRKPRRLVLRRVALIASACCVLVAAGLLLRRGRFGTALLGAADSVVLAQVENRTGDHVLDGVAEAGLHIALSQSSLIRLRSGQACRLARMQVNAGSGGNSPMLARKVAERLGAKAYIVGWLAGSGAPYTLHADLVNTLSNEVTASAEERAATTQDLPAAIDRLAETLRLEAGESKGAIERTGIPLSHEGTDNLGALNALSLGEDSLATSNLEDALRSFQQAARLDPQFIQAQLQLAVTYRRLRADVAAGEAARAARAVGDAASDRTRTLAEYEYEMNATGDYTRAAAIIRQLLAANPHDSEALEHLARTLRLQGRFAESLQNAQQAYAEDPYNLDAYTQAQNSLIGLDRYEAASQLGMQVKAMGIGSLGGDLASGYLQGRQDEIEAAITGIEQHKTGFRPDWNLGIYLDNVGRSAAATALWRERAHAAQQVPGLGSAAAFLLAQGAVDHALLGDCAAAMAMAHEAGAYPQGIAALYNTGMTDALCGDAAEARRAAETLERTYPQSFLVRSFYLADLKAAIALSSGDPSAALEILKPAQQYDLISMTPILRARAHVSLRQVQVGIVDLETVLARRGVPFVVGSVVYPVAQIGLARAFAATGDANNSASAYRGFLQHWRVADPRQPLLLEAAAHTR